MRVSFKKIIAGSLMVAMTFASTSAVFADGTNAQTYTRVTYDFESGLQANVDTCIVGSGWTPNAKQTLSITDNVGIDSSKAVKVELVPNDKTATNMSVVQTKRPFSVYAKSGDTVNMNVFVPNDAKVDNFKFSCRTGDGFNDSNQSSEAYSISNATLKVGQWNTVSMTVKETTVWPAGELVVSFNYTGDTYFYIDNLTVTGSTPNVPYENYVGLKSDTFNDISSMELVKAMQPGWNYGNTMEMGNEGGWNNLPVVKEVFTEIKNLGFNSVRVPMAWGSHVGPAPDYIVDQEWMDRCEKVTDWALESGLIVMINTHHDSSWISKGFNSRDPKLVQETTDKLKKIFLQIADRMKYKSEKLTFEFMNEVGASSEEIMDKVNSELLDAVRKSGGYNDKRTVVLAGRGHNVYNTLKSALPNDKHIAVSYHEYGTWDPFGRIEWGTDKDKLDVDKLLQQVYDKFTKNNIPVIIGEIGSYKPNYISNIKWYDYYLREANKKDIVYMIWDNGDKEGYYNRPGKYWREAEILQTIVAPVKGIVNSFVKEDNLYVKAGNEDKDITANLELNGNTLVSIMNGAKELVNGTDYTVNGSVLTLKGSWVKQTVSSADFGVKANLVIKFSQGLDTKIPLERYNTPELKQSTFTIDPSNVKGDLKIPVNFNGCKIATAKAYTTATTTGIDYVWTTSLTRSHIKFDDNFIYITSAMLKKVTSDVTYEYKLYQSDEIIKINLLSVNKAPEKSLGLPTKLWDFTKGPSPFEMYPRPNVEQTLVEDPENKGNNTLKPYWNYTKPSSYTSYARVSNVTGVVRGRIYVPAESKFESVDIVAKKGNDVVARASLNKKDTKIGWNYLTTTVIPDVCTEINIDIKNADGLGYLLVDDIEYGPEKLSAQPEELTVYVTNGDTYELPTTHRVLNPDLTLKETLPVKWEGKIDTKVDGYQRIFGKIEGYEGKAVLNVVVKATLASIEAINDSTYKGSNYSLPNTFTGITTDGLKWTIKSTPKWDNVVDTTKDGVQLFSAKIPEYSGDISLKLTVSSSQGISVVYNGTKIEFDQEPIIDNSRTFVPMRKIFEAMGATVEWDATTKTVKATKGDSVVSMKIGNKAVRVNGNSIVMDVAPMLFNGRTLVPVRAVAESLNANVVWDASTKTVNITSK